MHGPSVGRAVGVASSGDGGGAGLSSDVGGSTTVGGITCVGGGKAVPCDTSAVGGISVGMIGVGGAAPTSMVEVGGKRSCVGVAGGTNPPVERGVTKGVAAPSVAIEVRLTMVGSLASLAD